MICIKINVTVRRNIVLILCLFCIARLCSQPIIIDHTCTDITQIPQSAIENAKSLLHIGYGHTSHGSQLTTGMTGLVGFANGGGKGLSLPLNIFQWNNGGTGGALDLHDYFQSGDLGNPDRTTWADRTRTYLNNPVNADVNVIIWSWCGQADTTPENISLYLSLMNQLEIDYPSVKFVYMTGHAVGTGETGNLHLRNQQIRNYCIANNKILYDFYDIECYDPDGNYYGDQMVNDNCAYDPDGDGNRDQNWALNWQGSHTEGVDWYTCTPAHTQALNGNQKAYAAWWLWATLAGWDISLNVQMESIEARFCDEGILVTWSTASEVNCLGFHIWRSDKQDCDYKKLTTRPIPGFGNSSTSHSYQFIDQIAKNNHGYWYRIEELSQNGETHFFEPTYVENEVGNPSIHKLLDNYPNPFNSTTSIGYQLSVQSHVKLMITDLKGRPLSSLVDENQDPGYYTVSWDGIDESGKRVPSGIYLVQLYAEHNNIFTGKMVLVK